MQLNKVERGTDGFSHQGEAERICISNLQLTITLTSLILKCSNSFRFHFSYIILFCLLNWKLLSIHFTKHNIDAFCNNNRSLDLFSVYMYMHTYVHARIQLLRLFNLENNHHCIKIINPQTHLSTLLWSWILRILAKKFSRIVIPYIEHLFKAHPR